MKASKAELRAECDRLVTENTRLVASLAITRRANDRTCARLNERLANQARSINTLQAGLETAQADVREARTNRDTQRVKARKARAQLRVARALNDELRAEVASYRAENLMLHDNPPTIEILRTIYLPTPEHYS